MFKKTVAVSLIVCLLLGTSMPVYAASPVTDKVYKVIPDIWTWLDKPLFDTSSPYHGGGRESSPFGGGGRYDQYVNDVETNVGTVVLTKNGIRVYRISTAYESASATPKEVICGGTTTEYSGVLSSSGYVYIYHKQPLVVPFDSYITIGYEAIMSDCHLADSGNITGSINGTFIDDYKNKSMAKGTYSVNYWGVGFQPDVHNHLISFQLRTYVDLVPYDGVVANHYTDVDISIDNRMTVVMPSIYNYNTTNNTTKYYIGTVENNTVTNVYETNIFNETTNIFVEPSSNTTYNITNWTYDYKTRTYVCVDVDGNTYIVQYGDDAVNVTVPDGSGGTSRKTYHYITQTPPPSDVVTDPNSGFPDPSSDDYEDDPKTTGGFFSTIWKAFKEGLADLIAGCIKGLFKGLKALVSGIFDVFDGLVSGFFDAVSGFFNVFDTGNGHIFQFFNGGITDI